MKISKTETGYILKHDIKKILDAFDEHRKEVEKNAPHCDYSPVENCPGLWTKNK